MPRYRITIAYDGTDFHGWQRQHDTRDSPGTAIHGLSDEQLTDGRPLRTVQHVLERAVQAVVREPVTVLGASRTDAGVHAIGQVAAFTTSRDIPVEKLSRAITSRLPGDVVVKEAEIVPDAFDPIRDAIAKGYRYRFVHSCATEQRPLFSRNFVTATAYRLDPARMNEAARLLLGEHDFASFTRVAHGRESTVRTIFQCKVDRTSNRRCHLEVVGNGFLYNMVRIIAGTLLEVGRGAIEPEQMPEILRARDRAAAGPTLPPNGLCLMWIRYAESEDEHTRTPARPA
jgi:tRNA pseudouridine38-40 synthase